MPRDSAARKQAVELGVDELVTILRLASGDSISAKFTFAQVSRHWRATSLATAEVWSQFSVTTMEDALRLPTVLERARRALLDVSLDFSRRKQVTTGSKPELVHTIDAHDRADIYRDLSPRMPRVWRLAIDFGVVMAQGGWSEPLEELFYFAIPRMEDLSIVWRKSHWGLPVDAHQNQPMQQVLPILDTAFRLRSIRLMNVHPTTWDAILISGIETLYLESYVDDPDLLSHIVKVCPRLISMTFHPMCRPGFQFHEARVLTTTHRNLRCLNIRAGNELFQNVWDVLSPMLNIGDLEDITVVTTPDETERLSAGLVARSILPGLGPFVRSRMVAGNGPGTDSDLSVFDAAGRMRRIVTFMDDGLPYLEFWTALAEHNGKLDAMHSVCFGQKAWLAIGPAFVAHPLLHPNIEMRIVLGREHRENNLALRFDLRDMPKWTCLGLRRVVFEVNTSSETTLPLALGMLDKVDRAQKTEVCVADTGSTFRVQWVQRLKHEFKRRAGLVLCPHCLPLLYP